MGEKKWFGQSPVTSQRIVESHEVKSRRSKVESQKSKVESRKSKVEGRRSKVKRSKNGIWDSGFGIGRGSATAGHELPVTGHLIFSNEQKRTKETKPKVLSGCCSKKTSRQKHPGEGKRRPYLIVRVCSLLAFFSFLPQIPNPESRIPSHGSRFTVHGLRFPSHVSRHQRRSGRRVSPVTIIPNPVFQNSKITIIMNGLTTHSLKDKYFYM